MRELWNDRSPRERILLLIAASLFAVGMVYYMVVSPLGRWRSAMERDKEMATQTYSMIVEAASKGAVANARALGAASSEPIRNTLIQTARANAITLNFVNRRPNGDVEANVDAVEATLLYRWLHQLEESSAIKAISVDIAREQSNSGLVRAQLVFGRAQ